jgi:hypothetical protein
MPTRIQINLDTRYSGRSRLSQLLCVVAVSMLLLADSGMALAASSSPAGFEKKFSNCEALNKVYPGGVAKNKKATNMGGATSYVPLVSLKIYKANVSKDRDKDGIACER